LSVPSSKVNFQDGTDKEFPNVVISQLKPLTVGKPINEEISFGCKSLRRLRDGLLNKDAFKNRIQIVCTANSDVNGCILLQMWLD
jgi:hypothetical protein